MHKQQLNALILIASCALSTGVTAQNTYKCGNTYSQTPCPGASTIDTTDKRSIEQKNQTDLATKRDARVADAMETTRLRKEKRDLAANAPLTNPTSADLANFDAASGFDKQSQAKKKQSEYFTAQIPGEKKKKKTASKKAKAKTKALKASTS
jgi:hypothetical protein